MTSPSLNLRRATLDDLPALKALWTTANLPADELEARLTDFHIVESAGQFAGALGIQVLRQHARLHSEDYTDFSVADPARELFWERIQKISSNLGVFRLWTQQTSPFWKRWGFQAPDAETLERLPEEWKSLEGTWLTLELKNEDAIKDALQHQFAGFMDEEKKQTARIVGHARILRILIIVGAFAFFFLCLGVAFYLMMHGQQIPR